MNVRLLLATGLLMLAVPSVAQDNGSGRDEFKSHMFLQLQGGVQHTLGEASFSDLISPNVQAALGWQASPWLGLRLGASAWQSRGGFNSVVLSNGLYGNATYKYKYVAPAIDVMFNLSNVLCGYNPKRVVNVTAFVGAGANIAFGNDEAVDLNNSGYTMAYIWEGTKVRPVGRGGLAIDFRLSSRVSIGIEGNANVLSDRYNSKDADSPDWYFNALAGIKIALGRTTRKAQPAPEPIPEPVAPPVERPVVVEKPQPAPVETVEEKAPEGMTRDIFFLINSSNVRESEMPKIVELAEYLKANPDANLNITGYADAETGTKAINDRLSQQRAEAVADILVKGYGISADRITTASEGARVQPFSENEKNRVSICVTEP